MVEVNLENRINELESKMAFNDYTIEQLSNEIANQQQEIERLMLEVKFLRGKLKDFVGSNVALPSEETPPPHY